MTANNKPDNSCDRLHRRRFLQIVGIGACAAGASQLLSCVGKSNNDKNSHLPTESAVKENGTMTYRQTPTTGDKVSLLGFGCMRFPTRTDDDGNDELDQEQINRLIDHALEHGVNYFDTSPAYCKGRSEAALGIALSRHPRDSYYIATKLSNFAPQTWPRSKSIEMFENSLRYLRTDYVDYLLLHAIGQGGMDAYNGRYEDNGILDYLIDQRNRGRIRNLGFSYHGDVEVFDHLLKLHDEGRVKWDFVQIQLNYIDWLHAKEVNQRNTNAEYLYGQLMSRGIPAVIMEPLLGGRLASANEHIAAQMKSRRPDNSIASWAFRFAGTPEGVLTVLSGMTYMEHLRDNLATFSPLEPLDSDESDFLENVAIEMLAHPLIGCTDCKYCMPCPYGVDIPAVFAQHNKCINANIAARADSEHAEYAEKRRAYLADLSRTVPRGRQADQCIGCAKCVSHCPQHINIPARLAEISSYNEYLRSHKA